ncbi:MAG: hydroxymethylglutaryl-CoA lyase [Ilumatobacteraceae bacterium]
MTVTGVEPLARIAIRDVTARDGLQGERPVHVAARVGLVRHLLAAGLADVEVASFVSPTAVPAMAGGAEVVAAILPELAVGQTAWALVPNRRGAELATAVGIGHLTITVSASAAYSAKNVRMTPAESMAQVGAIRSAAPDAVLDLVVSCAFGSPFDGEVVTPDDVAAVVAEATAIGVERVTLADTTGVATPRSVGAVLDVVGVDVGLHLHDTRATALLNAWTSIGRGVTRFDTALGGLGGSPFAPAAGGNLATEDLVNVLADAGYETGVDLGLLLATGPLLAELVGHALPSRVAATLGPAH